MTTQYVYSKCKVSNDYNLFFQAGYTDRPPSYCNDTIQLEIGTGSNIMITAANQERYRYATFIASNHTVVITFTSCFRYLMASGYMYQFKIETTGMQIRKQDNWSPVQNIRQQTTSIDHQTRGNQCSTLQTTGNQCRTLQTIGNQCRTLYNR